MRLHTGSKTSGYFFAVVSAVCYGLNPLWAKALYNMGLNTNSVLLYRYCMAVIIMGAMLWWRKARISVTLQEFGTLSRLGLFFILSSISLFVSFRVMDVGVASTLLFVYPVMTAVIMALFFREKLQRRTIVSVVLSFLGVCLLYRGGQGSVVTTIGVVLALFSAFTYTLYIIGTNRAKLQMGSLKISFYVSLCCIAGTLLFSLIPGTGGLQWPNKPMMWVYELGLAIFPTILSLYCLTKAVRVIGSTPAAILGALEPLTAVTIGIFVFKEAFTWTLAGGIALILSAMLLTILVRQKK